MSQIQANQQWKQSIERLIGGATHPIDSICKLIDPDTEKGVLVYQSGDLIGWIFRSEEDLKGFSAGEGYMAVHPTGFQLSGQPEHLSLQQKAIDLLFRGLCGTLTEKEAEHNDAHFLTLA